MADAQGRSPISMVDFAVAFVNKAELPRHRLARFMVGYDSSGSMSGTCPVRRVKEIGMTIASYPVTDPVAEHGEGPVWSGRWGGLRWVDMLADDVLMLDPDGIVRRRHVARIAAVVRPRVSGGYRGRPTRLRLWRDSIQAGDLAALSAAPTG
ncbi:hypothetical protein [Nonomuraea cypriaca]|uniref:hypothetical protein n=1 Tax=Nonomuraea cypriaca TaxID=1187855 RepID=UPI001A9C2DFB|nr:hypothetical protein [Nonomuraea cypriaca]